MYILEFALPSIFFKLAVPIEDQGFELVYNQPGDGNCQIAALAHQVKKLGILRSPETMKKK